MLWAGRGTEHFRPPGGRSGFWDGQCCKHSSSAKASGPKMAFFKGESAWSAATGTQNRPPGLRRHHLNSSTAKMNIFGMEKALGQKNSNPKFLTPHPQATISWTLKTISYTIKKPLQGQVQNCIWYRLPHGSARGLLAMAGTLGLVREFIVQFSSLVGISLGPNQLTRPF